MCNSRTLSDQNIFIIRSTKMVTGIKVRSRPRRSSARCMKYISPSVALQIASRSRTTTSVPVAKCWKDRNTSTRKMASSMKYTGRYLRITFPEEPAALIVSPPAKASVREIREIHQGHNEHPDQVHEVPVQSGI